MRSRGVAFTLFFCIVFILPVFVQAKNAKVVTYQPIELIGPVADRNSQISGMDWWGDTLILLPQYPDWQDGESVLFSIPKQEIIEYLESETPSPILPSEVPFRICNSILRLRGFEGFEAISFNGNTVFVTIEVKNNSSMSAYIARGMVDDSGGINLDCDPVRLPVPVQVDNMAFESLTQHWEHLLAFFEANTAKLQKNPSAFRCTRDLKEGTVLSIESVNYRLTDVSRPDENSQFWGTNIFTELEAEKLRGARKDDPCDVLVKNSNGMEKIIPLIATTEGIFVDSNRPTLCLKPVSEANPVRNWEGLVNLDDRGLLIITDMYPETLFGFVAYP